jgi:hypothetical protein
LRQKEKGIRLSRLNHGLYRHQELRGLTSLGEVWHADARMSIKCLYTIAYGNICSHSHMEWKHLSSALNTSSNLSQSCHNETAQNLI